MNCPECNEKAKSLPGGDLGAVHSTRYYRYLLCEIKFKTVGPVVQIMSEEPESPFKNSREAARVLRQAVAPWFFCSFSIISPVNIEKFLAALIKSITAS